MRFNYFMPSGILREYVEYYFLIERDPTENSPPTTVFPNIHLEMAFSFGSPESSFIRRGEQPLVKTPDYSVDGFSTKISSYFNKDELGVIMVGFKPWGLQQFIPFSMEEFLNKNLDLREVWPKEIGILEDELHAKHTDPERIAVIEQFLLRKATMGQTDKLIEYATMQVINANGTIPVKELASEHYLSQKQFNRRFIRAVGTTPKLFSRIVRFQRILSLMKREEMQLTEMAFEAGYYDQSHFIKEFRQFTNESPSSFEHLTLQTTLGKYFEEQRKKSIFYNSVYL